MKNIVILGLALSASISIHAQQPAQKTLDKHHNCPSAHKSFISELKNLDTTKFCVYDNRIYMKGSRIEQAGQAMSCKIQHTQTNELSWSD